MTTANKAIRILIVEDEEADAELLHYELRKSGLVFESTVAATKDAFQEALAEPWDVVLSDYRMKGFSGLDAIDAFQRANISTPVIIVTGTLGDELAAECVKRGADDFLLKDRLGRLPTAIQRAIDRSNSRAVAEERQRRYEAVFSGLGEGVFVTSIDGPVIEVNSAFLAMFGYDRSDLLSLRAEALYADTQASQGLLDHLADEGEVRRFEAMFRRKDGSAFRGEITATLEATGSREICGVVRDITELLDSREAQERQNRELLERNEELLRTNRELRGLNNLFQQHLDERMMLGEALVRLVKTAEESPRDLDRVLAEVKGLSIPDIQRAFGRSR